MNRIFYSQFDSFDERAAAGGRQAGRTVGQAAYDLPRTPVPGAPRRGCCFSTWETSVTSHRRPHVTAPAPRPRWCAGRELSDEQIKRVVPTCTASRPTGAAATRASTGRRVLDEAKKIGLHIDLVQRRWRTSSTAARHDRAGAVTVSDGGAAAATLATATATAPPNANKLPDATLKTAVTQLLLLERSGNVEEVEKMIAAAASRRGHRPQERPLAHQRRPRRHHRPLRHRDRRRGGAAQPAGAGADRRADQARRCPPAQHRVVRSAGAEQKVRQVLDEAVKIGLHIDLVAKSKRTADGRRSRTSRSP